MKNITDTVNDVCMVTCYVTKWVTITSALDVYHMMVSVCMGHYYYIRALHVPYKSELIIT